MTLAARTDLMLPPGTFNDRTIIVTGGGTGLGRSMAQTLLSLGANVAICGRRADVLTATAAELAQATGGAVLAQPCDVRRTEQVEALIAATAERFGSVHGLVNNAAGNFICPTERLSFNAFHSVVDIVLAGTMHCTLACGKRWIDEGTPGAVLNIVATYAWTGSGYVVPSAVAKAGVLALTRSLASEWGKYAIRTNAIAPGPFPTEGARSRLMPPALAEFADAAKRIPLGRVGEHQELANLAAYLLSDYAAYVTGACVTIDGGEWLKGAGEFNYLDAVSGQQWDELQALLKPKNREGNR
ncbi:MAG TPA: SDR family oxidoreductase [Pirellulales bacterium]|jgi:NAD(P)-dependent dehydrogenase (short-subunit alcohol dehydrogenase family)|nr:SDR family oxidoreductase [Pirellulales bacterium]